MMVVWVERGALSLLQDMQRRRERLTRYDIAFELLFKLARGTHC